MADRQRILLIEHEQALRTTFCLLLQRAGYQVAQVDGTWAGFEVFNENPFHLVIVCQSEFNSEDMIQLVQSTGSQGLHVLILTNGARAQITQVPGLMITHLNTPIDPEEFLFVVDRLLSGEVIGR